MPMRAGDTLSLSKFIADNREEIDEVVRRILKRPDWKMNDAERRLWVLNDEGLYHWACRSGCRV